MTFPYLDALLLVPADSLKTAMDRIQQNAHYTGGSGVVFIVDDKRRLLGALTDGDIRRALLRGLPLSAAVAEAMTTNPIAATRGTTPHQLLRLFNHGVRHIPLLDDERRVVDMVLYSEFAVAPRSRPVVIRAKVPVRVSFAGGGSDFPEHFERYGGAVISATIDRYCHGLLTKRADSRVVLHSYDYGVRVEAEGVEELRYDGTLDLLKAAVKLSKPAFGFELHTWSDVPPGSGLASSAVMTTVVIGLFNELAEERLDEYQISDLAYQVERIELGITGGWQDQYAASFGGLNFIEFTERDVVVHPLRLKERIVNELESNLLLCFTGLTRDSGQVHTVARETPVDPARRDEIRVRTSRLAVDIRDALVRGHLNGFGDLLHQGWLLKKELAPGVTNPLIDRLYEAALAAGAAGGKLLGAGSGGHMLFYCPPLRAVAVRDALRKLGAESLSFNFDFRGMRVWQTTGETA
jgi:D-glycero-alpha-D-manno-heptose-7-phosphate kinase